MSDFVIAVEQRERATKMIVKHLSSQFAKNETKQEEQIVITYNSAVDDILGAIEVYSKENRQHFLAFQALKAQLENWKLVEQPNG